MKTELIGEIALVRVEAQQTKTELQGEIQQTKTELQAEINTVRAEAQQTKTELQGEIQQTKIELEGKILELGTKMDGYGKRLEQQEFVSRGATVALVAGVASGFVKYFFFSD